MAFGFMFRGISVVAVFAASTYAAPLGIVTERIAVDQFGYLPGSPKVAVISDPQIGFNAAESYTPGSSLEVRRWDTNEVAFSGSRTTWNNGQTHDQSGDKVWWFDFSTLDRWGTFYIYDPATQNRSFPFRIGHDVYFHVLREATRVFYYQRSGFAKTAPFTDSKWADGASHLGPLQDTHCRLVTAPNDASKEKDLRGGWFDAGDYNKYVNFATGPVCELLLAYQRNPSIWTDDFGIPESGNGIPDLLDEVKWELDWLLRMQNSNGSVLSKVSVASTGQANSPASKDDYQRFYGAASTSSTLNAAGAFALGAKIFGAIGQSSYSTQLRTAAANAWTWAVANPSVVFSNTGFDTANPEGDSYGRSMAKLRAAVYLYALTGDATYKSYVDSNYTAAQSMQWGYWYSFETATQDALIYYAGLPDSTSAVANEIKSSKQSSIGGDEFLAAWNNKTDAYRAYLKTPDINWGSNQHKAHVGVLFQDMVSYGIDTSRAATYRSAAEAYLHSLHGINPLTLVHLTNMYGSGASKSANEMYHAWFGDGTIWDNAITSPAGPPPGYVPGGPNPSWRPDSAYTGPTLEPPANQPALKSYRDWNTSWPQNSWEVTEPAIYYQAAYVHLLSRLLTRISFAEWINGMGMQGTDANLAADPDRDGASNLEEYSLGRDPAKADAQRGPRASLENGRLTLRFIRPLSGDIRYVIEASSSLAAGTWTSVATLEPTAIAWNTTGTISENVRPDGARDVVFTDSTSQSSQAKRFLRLRVEKP